MKLSIIGDVHGKIQAMYQLMSQSERGLEMIIDSIVQVGDFKAFRDEQDLNVSTGPIKYRSLGDFPVFYNSGKVPKQTYFIGGNHENNRWHSIYPEGHELVHGLRYLGRSGTLNIGGVTFGWVSGNYSSKDFKGNGKYHHFTKADCDKILNAGKKIDVLLFHDWPSIRKLNNHYIPKTDARNSNLEQAIKRNLGSNELYDVVMQIRPRYVFAGHVHMPLDLDTDIDGVRTRFIALDKIRDLRNSFYVLDTDDISIKKYTVTSGDFTDIINKNDALKNAFGLLENNNFDEAQELFMNALGGEKETNSLAYYGLAVCLLKRTPSAKTTDQAIGYLHRSLQLEHPDIHQLMASALHIKSTYVTDSGPRNQILDKAHQSEQRAKQLRTHR